MVLFLLNWRNRTMLRISTQVWSECFILFQYLSFNFLIYIIYNQVILSSNGFHQYRCTYLKSVKILFVSFLLLVLKSEGNVWFCALLISRSFQLLFTIFAGRFPIYCPFIYFSAFRKSLGCANETKPYPLVLPVLLSLTTLAILKDEYRVRKAFAKTSSLV